MFERALIIGASRGLGRSVALYLSSQLGGVKNVTLASRKPDLLEKTKTDMTAGRGAELVERFSGSIEIVKFDASRDSDVTNMAAMISEKSFDLVIYNSGGGPHGEFCQKEWKDHSWALNVNLATPMHLCHQWLKSRDSQKLGRFVIVGSRIAEQSPDPLAVSYAAGKHGLVGFVSSIQSELEANQNKVWLFSPGYMDSEMLPHTAHIRHDGSKLMSVDTAAQAMLRWLKKDGPWHRILN
jgi:short-subunit dehydrogenase